MKLSIIDALEPEKPASKYKPQVYDEIEAVTIGARDGRKQLVNMVLTEADNASD